MPQEPNPSQILTEIEELKVEVRNVRSDIKEIHKQMPNEDNLQSVPNCKTTRRWFYTLFGAVGAALMGVIGWLFKLSTMIGKGS